jgi:hypothetical protein
MNNLERFTSVISVTTELMRTRYADVVPEDYVRVWNREHKGWLKIRTLKSLVQQQDSVLVQLSGIGPASGALSMLEGIMRRVALSGEYVLLYACFIVQMFEWSLPLRVIQRIWHKWKRWRLSHS